MLRWIAPQASLGVSPSRKSQKVSPLSVTWGEFLKCGKHKMHIMLCYDEFALGRCMYYELLINLHVLNLACKVYDTH